MCVLQEKSNTLDLCCLLPCQVVGQNIVHDELVVMMAGGEGLNLGEEDLAIKWCVEMPIGY